MAVSEPADRSVAAGLEMIRQAERLSLSRALHDQLGPSLCSAGLLLGLLRDSAGELPPAARELLASIGAALEQAVENVRTLSYLAEPTVASRCGLRTALGYAARGCGAEPLADVALPEDDENPGMPPFTGPQADAACRILQDALLVACTGPRTPRIGVVQDRLALSNAADLPPEAFSALAAAGHACGLNVEWHAKGEDRILMVSAGGTD